MTEIITIPLGKSGKAALVDLSDAPSVTTRKWYPRQLNRPNGPSLWYACDRSGQFLHRFILSASGGQRIDHVNSNGLDCRRVNMRLVTATQNVAHKRPRAKKLTSRYKGVDFWHANPTRTYWRAQIKAGAKRVTRYCRTEVAAAKAYNELASEHFGEFAWLNSLPVEV